MQPIRFKDLDLDCEFYTNNIDEVASKGKSVLIKVSESEYVEKGEHYKNKADTTMNVYEVDWFKNNLYTNEFGDKIQRIFEVLGFKKSKNGKGYKKDIRYSWHTKINGKYFGSSLNKVKKHINEIRGKSCSYVVERGELMSHREYF